MAVDLSHFSIVDVMNDPRLLGSVFGSPSWDSWRSLLRIEYALPLADSDRERFRQLAARTCPPLQWVRRSYRRIGRRGGKDSIAALEAVYRSAFCTYPLRVGEVGIVLLLSATQRQARLLHRAVSAFFRHSPLLAPLVISETAETIELRNNIVIEVVAANTTAPRNRTIVFAICNETASWPADEHAAHPDIETLNSIEPGMATIPTGKIVVMSSPNAPKGELLRAHQRYWGRDDLHDIVYWTAPTGVMNPQVDPRVLARAYADDPARARAEFGAEFRADIEGFVTQETIRACVVSGRFELPPQPAIFRYDAVRDPAGGSGQDSDTIAFGHVEQRNGLTVAVVDCLRESRPPFSPESVSASHAAVCQAYGVTRIRGDRFGGEWPREAMRRHGIQYDLLDKPKSELYQAALPLLNSGRIELLDAPRLLAQLGSLERRAGSRGDVIDHGVGQHDDLANVVCALAVQLIGWPARRPQALLFTGGGDGTESLETELARLEAELRGTR